MTNNAQKNGSLKQKRLKLQHLPTDVENNHIDRLADNLGTPEADNSKPRAKGQQQNEFQGEIREQNDNETRLADFDELNKAREDLMTYEK